MELSEIEICFLHEFEESDEDLYLLEIDVRLHFANDNDSPFEIRERVKNTIRNLYSKKLIELHECHYVEEKPGYFKVTSINKLPDSSVDEVLNNNKNWDKDYLFRQTKRFYFHPTKKGLEYLDALNT